MQEVTPVRQASGFGSQASPAVHDAQMPALQTWFTPQVVPFAMGVAVSMQRSKPVEQSLVPWTQLFGFVEHATPAVQALQVPSPQTWFVPHDVPFATNAPVSVQTSNPVRRRSPPTWQMLVGVQDEPAAQALQVPSPQTMSVPQVVPLATGVAVSLQTGPALHERVHTWQEFSGVHTSPSTQLTHVPAEQTKSTPQFFPSGALPLSTQAGNGPAQEIAPVWHGSADSHAAPSVHDRKSHVDATDPLTPQSRVKAPWTKSVPFTWVPT